MARVAIGILLAIALTGAARAQSPTGWAASIGVYDKTGLPAINQPQPEWSKVVDIVTTDGTAPVPPCGDLNVIATVRNGISRYFSSLAGDVQGNDSIKIAMTPIWVHETFSGRYVCDTTIDFSDYPLGNEPWKFETFAKDGRALVFFYGENEQTKQ